MANRIRNLAILITILLSIVISSVGVLVQPVYADGNWETWKQYDPKWSGVSMGGGSNVGATGCFVSAVAIQAVRSGLTKTVDGETINPGTTASAFVNHGVLQGGMLHQTNTGKAIKDFDHVDTKMGIGGLSDADKIAQIQQYINSGYYPTIQTNNIAGGTHFVAVKEIKDGVIYMYDSGSDSTNFNETYGVSSIQQMNAFSAPTKIQDAKGGGATVQEDVEVKDKDGEKLKVKAGRFTENDIPNMPKPRDYEDKDMVIALNTLVAPNNNEVDDLKSDDQLQAWVDEYHREKEIKYIGFSRMILMFVGSFLVTYTLFLIATYSFDRVGATPIRLFNWVTLGKLEVAYDGQSTFKDKDAYVRKVTVGNLIFIVSILLLVASLILTGAIFDILDSLLNIMRSMIDFFKGIKIEF